MSEATNPYTNWIPGDTPDIPKGEKRAYWVTLQSKSTGRLSVVPMVYMHAYVMPLHDSADEPPSCAVPHQPESDGYSEDFEWTCWSGGECENCETYWVWHDRYADIIAYAPAPEPYQGGDDADRRCLPRLVRPGDRLLVAVTFPEELEESESCHPDILLADFLGSRDDGSWEVEVCSVLKNKKEHRLDE